MNKRNILLLFLLSAVCLLPSVYAQGGIKGKVRNNKGNGIGGASVSARLNGKDVKTVTADSKGNFLMEGLKAGTYNISFDADGYAMGVKFGVEIKNGSVRDLGDRLILSVDQGTLLIVKGSVFFKEGTSLDRGEDRDRTRQCRRLDQESREHIFELQRRVLVSTADRRHKGPDHREVQRRRGLEGDH
jgi:hypothetical protein